MRATGFDAVAAEGGNAPVKRNEAGADVGVQFVSRDVTKLVPAGATGAHLLARLTLRLVGDFLTSFLLSSHRFDSEWSTHNRRRRPGAYS